MGSRAILFLFRDTEASKKHTGIESLGVIYTRTGRRFFDVKTEEQLILNINRDLHESGYFEKYETDYVLLDAEIMPWNLKAKELIRNQYAHVAENAILDRTMLEGKNRESGP